MSITVIIVDRFPNDIFDYVFMSLELITSLIAFSFMMKTKKKQIVVPPKRGSLRGRVLDSHPNTVDNDRPIKIYLDYKIKKDEDISFRVVTEKVDKRVKRNFNEFLDVENYLIEYIKKHNRRKIHEVPTINKKSAKSSTVSGITQAAENRLK